MIATAACKHTRQHKHGEEAKYTGVQQVAEARAVTEVHGTGTRTRTQQSELALAHGSADSSRGTPHLLQVRTLSFSHDSVYVACGSEDPVLEINDVASGERVRCGASLRSGLSLPTAHLERVVPLDLT
eukprot:6212130-Pleurochrysis_carterae.AAC.2